MRPLFACLLRRPGLILLVPLVRGPVGGGVDCPNRIVAFGVLVDQLDVAAGGVARFFVHRVGLGCVVAVDIAVARGFVGVGSFILRSDF